MSDSFDQTPLGELFEIVKGSICPFLFPDEEFAHHSLPAFDSTGGPIIEFGRKIESNKTLLSGPVVLLSKLNPRTSRVSLADPTNDTRRHCCSTEFIAYKAKRNNISNIFYKYYFQTDQFRIRLQNVAIGTTNSHVRVNPSETLTWEVPYPPKQKQTKIAEILSTVDRSIEQTEALIAKQQRIKIGLMKDLLTRGIDESGNLRSEQTHQFKDSPLGRIPVEWEVVSLSYFIKRLDAGVSVNSEDKPCGCGQIGVLKTSALNKGNFFPQQNKTVLQTEENRVRISPVANSILISRMNTPDLVGESGFVYKDYPNLFLPDRIWMTVFQEGKEEAARWLSFVMTSPHARNYITLNATGTSGSMKNLPKTSLFRMPLCAPVDSKEQHQIACLLECHNSETDRMNQLMHKLRSIKTALMQELLTGTKRVTPLLESETTN